MQFQVPQFIETEDKIVGPMTLRQFLYIGATAGLVFLLFFIVELWLWFVLTLIMAAVGVALAFAKVNGKSFLEIASSAVKFYWRPQTYVWKPKKEGRPTESSVQPQTRSSFSLESLAQGLALKTTWQKLQTKTSPIEAGQDKKRKEKERYQIFEKITGERRAARRVDYR